jgi:CubicO group peptidase (beta-lactamase class C family)
MGSSPLILLPLLALLLVTGQGIAAARPAPTGEIDFAALDAAVKAQKSKHGLPGVALAIVEGDEIVYSKGYGSAGPGRPMTARTRMLIGSQSKSFTALAIAQLAERGMLDLNTPVQSIIPWFRVADEGASGKITITHLLHHTSGLSDSGYDVVLPADATPEEAVRSLAGARLTAPVGAKHQYFNTGYSVLAYIVELVSGETYSEYIQTHILAPLRMDASTADPLAAEDLAQGYSRLFGFPVPMHEQIPAYAVGEGYIVSTAEDLARYAIAVKSDGGGLVSAATMDRILAPGPGSYGLGWMIADNGAKIFHGGANQTFRTEVNIYPGLDRAFTLLSNEGYQVDHFVSASQLASTVEAFVRGGSPPPVSQGWSVRWVGWGLAALVFGLIALHTRNFLALRGWGERARQMSRARRAVDVAISFLIPAVILVVVFSQVKAFYGDRFSLWRSLIYMPWGLPDVFILLLIGTLPDFTQGVIKLFSLRPERQRSSPATMRHQDTGASA